MRYVSRLLWLMLASSCCAATMLAQGPTASAKPHPTPKELEHEFFAAIRDGDARSLLGYIPKNGVNVGSQPEHVARKDIEQQFAAHHGLYCKLFDSSCIEAPIDLQNSARTCSDRELLQSKNVRTASSEVTRNNVRQAVLVAEVHDDNCPSQHLVDFVFNLEADGWKLFSIP